MNILLYNWCRGDILHLVLRHFLGCTPTTLNEWVWQLIYIYIYIIDIDVDIEIEIDRDSYTYR